MRDSSQPFEPIVGLALLEERCPGLITTLETVAQGDVGSVALVKRQHPGPLAGDDVTASLAWLERAGALTFGDRPSTSGQFVFAVKAKQVLREAAIAAAAIAVARERPRRQDLPRLVVSWPPSVRRPSTLSWRNSRMTIIELLDSAELSAVMVFPFVDRGGADEISAAIVRALHRGVDVVLVTRYLTDPESPNARLVAGIERLEDRERKHLTPLHLAGETDAGHTREVLHAKAMSVDGGRRGYVGSANLTGTALDESLEVGVVLEGPAARDLGTLLTEIAEIAKSA